MSAERIYTVYAARHVASGRYYFGQTASSVTDRWTAHVSDSSSRASTGLAKAIREYGADAFTVSALLTNLDRAQADEWERRMVEQFEARGTFNFMFTERARKACGARKRGVKASPETRAKMSAAHRARWAGVSAEDRRAALNPFAEAGASARRGKRRVLVDGKVTYVERKPDEDPVEMQRERWRRKAKNARARRAAKKAAGL